MNTIIKKFLPETLPVILGAIILSYGAIYNGFPLIFFDTWSYIAEGFAGKYVTVRPISYGFFVKFMSGFGSSLFLVIFGQNLILSFILRRFQIDVLSNRSIGRFLFLMSLGSVIFGGTWIQSQIMADATTPIFMLSALGLVFLPVKMSLLHLLFGIFFIFSGCCHMSHLVMTLPILLGLFVFKKFRPNFDFNIKSLALSTLLLWVMVPTLNSLSGGGFRPVSAYQPMFLGKLATSGALHELLKNNCNKKEYLFCQHWRQGTFPMNGRDLIWEIAGPIGSTHGLKNHPDYLEMIKDTFIQHPLIVSTSVLKTMFLQFFQFELGDRLFSYARNPWTNYYVKQYFPDSYRFFLYANQQKGHLDFFFPNVLLYASLLCFLVLISLKKTRTKMTHDQMKMLTCLLIFLISNAIVCGASADGLIDRYQARVMWLLPLLLSYFLSLKKAPE